MNGAIFIKLDIGNGSIDQLALISATKRFLKDTSRVKLVVYCWDGSPIENAIALEYCAVDLNDSMGAIFGSAFYQLFHSS